MPEDRLMTDRSGELARLLKQADILLSEAEVRNWAHGLAGAPERDPSLWIELVAPNADAELAANLVTLAHDIRCCTNSGLGESPAPHERIV